MKKRILTLILLAIGLTIKAQVTNIQIVDTVKINDPLFKSLYKRSLKKSGFTNLPFERNVLKEEVGETFPYRTNHYFQKTYPFFYKESYKESEDLNLYCHYNDTVKEACEESFIQVIEKTTGKYLLAVLYMIGKDHSTFQYVIVTYDYDGNYIDQLLFTKRYDRGYRKEGIIKEDLKILTSELTFDTPQYVYTTTPRPTGAKFDDKIGQRVDCTYSITEDGHFRLEKKQLFKPQLYTGEYFFNKGPINQGNEIPLE